MNQQAFTITCTTYEDYVKWCNKHHRPIKSINSKRDFFEKVLHKKLAKNELTGELIVKKPRRKK